MSRTSEYQSDARPVTMAGPFRLYRKSARRRSRFVSGSSMIPMLSILSTVRHTGRCGLCGEPGSTYRIGVWLPHACGHDLRLRSAWVAPGPVIIVSRLSTLDYTFRPNVVSVGTTFSVTVTGQTTSGRSVAMPRSPASRVSATGCAVPDGVTRYRPTELVAT